jgi:hypothetical protein
MSFPFESLPKSLQAYTLANVRTNCNYSKSQFVDAKQLTLLRTVSSRCKNLIDISTTIWKQQYLNNFPTRHDALGLSNQADWFSNFIIAWKEEKYNSFDTSFKNREGKFSHFDRTAVHGKGIYYFPLRTKFGTGKINSKLTFQGYKKGVHYWEVTTNVMHAYIGVCTTLPNASFCLGDYKCKM